MVAELRGLWAKQKMQSRQMKIRVTVKHKTLKNAAPDTFSSVTQDKFLQPEMLWLNNTEDVGCGEATKNNSHTRRTRCTNFLIESWCNMCNALSSRDTSTRRRSDAELLPAQSRLP